MDYMFRVSESQLREILSKNSGNARTGRSPLADELIKSLKILNKIYILNEWYDTNLGLVKLLKVHSTCYIMFDKSGTTLRQARSFESLVKDL